MGLTINFDNGGDQTVFGGDVGSNKAWGNFCRWINAIQDEGFTGLNQLCEHGWTNHPQDVAKELRTALERFETDQYIKGTAETILQLIADRCPKESKGIYCSRGS